MLQRLTPRPRKMPLAMRAPPAAAPSTYDARWERGASGTGGGGGGGRSTGGGGGSLRNAGGGEMAKLERKKGVK